MKYICFADYFIDSLILQKLSTHWALCFASLAKILNESCASLPDWLFLQKLSTHWALCFASLAKILNESCASLPDWLFLQKLSTHWALCFASLAKILNESCASLPDWLFLQKLSTHWALCFASLAKILNESCASLPDWLTAWLFVALGNALNGTQLPQWQLLNQRKTPLTRCFSLVYRLPPISRPGLRRWTMSLLLYFFGERVF
jgi:hypothetical protein